MKIVSVVAALGLFAAGATVPCCVSAAALEQGTTELEVNLGLDHVTSGKGGLRGTRLDGMFGVGRCMDRVIEFGGELLFSHESYAYDSLVRDYYNYDQDYNLTSAGLAVQVTLNFPTSTRLVPYVRLGMGSEVYAGADGMGRDPTIWAPMVRAGLRVMAGESGSVNMSLAYRHEYHSEQTFVADPAISGVWEGWGNNEADRWSLNVGLSLFPGRGK